MKYWYPKFDGIELLACRIGGPGLGNLLFTWARAHVACKRAKGKLLSPTWRQIKPLRILRADKDLRAYAEYFLPQADEISGIRKACILIFFTVMIRLRFTSSDRLNIVSGMGRKFQDIEGQSAHLFKRFLSLCHPDIRLATTEDAQPNVGIHIRLGDFQQTNEQELARGASNLRIPIAWYLGLIHNIKLSTAGPVRFQIFTDGTRAQIQDVLNIEGCELRSGSSPVSDLLAMTNCALLVGSRSTFSCWAAYFGQMPSIWYPGQDLEGIYSGNDKYYFSTSGEIDEKFVADALALANSAANVEETGLQSRRNTVRI